MLPLQLNTVYGSEEFKERSHTRSAQHLEKMIQQYICFLQYTVTHIAIFFKVYYFTLFKQDKLSYKAECTDLEVAADSVE